MKKELTEQQINLKRDLKRKQKYSSITRKYNKMLGLRQEKIKSKQQKEIDRTWNKRQKLRDIELHNLTAKRKKKIPEDKTIGKVKAKALAKIQEYSKLRRAYVAGGVTMVFVYDKQISVPLDKKVNGGHVYSKGRFQHMAFDERNIYPITSRGNKQQLDNTAEWRINIPKEEQIYLENKSKDVKLKNELRDRNFYLGIIEKYTDLIEKEKKRLGL